jgi:hypothetical protein
MTQPLYDIYFTGQLVEGTEPEVAKTNLAQLFKTNVHSISKLFNGKAQLLKRGVDKPAALKYKAALHKAGLLVAFKAHQATLAAEKPDTSNTQAAANVVTTPNDVVTPNNVITTPPNEAAQDFTLAPIGSDVLNENEKQKYEQQEIDTSNIKLASVFADPKPEHKDAPPAPDTSHISVANVGEDLLIDRPEAPLVLDFDLNDISIAPVGADLEQLHEDLPQVNPNINGISIAPLGSDLIPNGGKKRQPRPPNTDHITVADS